MKRAEINYEKLTLKTNTDHYYVLERIIDMHDSTHTHAGKLACC